ncbi:MAG: GNAT family N-acetyltransferase [Candidatus Dormibacteria bacterium]
MTPAGPPGNCVGCSAPPRPEHPLRPTGGPRQAPADRAGVVWHTAPLQESEAARRPGAARSCPERLLQGRLVRLCAPRDGDGKALSRWSEDGEYRRLADTGAPRPQSPEHFEEGPGQEVLEFRLRTLSDDRLVGFVALFSIEWPNRCGWIAIGIGDPADRGRGFGREGAELAIHYAFHELGLHRLTLDVIADNLPAVGLYRSLGFREEGRLRERVLREGRWTDLLYLGLLRREWEASAAASATGS